MERRARLHAVLPAVIALVITACASSKPVPPPVDPVKEQVLILQKQLLELQSLQIETRRKLDEQTALTEILTSRLKTVEEQQLSASRMRSLTSTSPTKKKPAKNAVKKKTTRPVRRQEQ